MVLFGAACSHRTHHFCGVTVKLLFSSTSRPALIAKDFCIMMFVWAVPLRKNDNDRKKKSPADVRHIYKFMI